MPDAVHGYRLVQVAAPAPAPSRLVDVTGRPMGTGRLPAPPAGAPATLLPHRRGSAQLLRPGINRETGEIADPYQELLDRLPDITPEDGKVPLETFAALMPDANATAAVIQPRHASWRGGSDANVTVADDPVEDAWGRRPPNLVSVPLAE